MHYTIPNSRDFPAPWLLPEALDSCLPPARVEYACSPWTIALNEEAYANDRPKCLLHPLFYAKSFCHLVAELNIFSIIQPTWRFLFQKGHISGFASVVLSRRLAEFCCFVPATEITTYRNDFILAFPDQPYTRVCVCSAAQASGTPCCEFTIDHLAV